MPPESVGTLSLSVENYSGMASFETARASVSSGGHSSSYWCQQRQLGAGIDTDGGGLTKTNGHAATAAMLGALRAELVTARRIPAGRAVRATLKCMSATVSHPISINGTYSTREDRSINHHVVWQDEDMIASDGSGRLPIADARVHTRA